MRILGISGSLRAGSLNTRLLRFAAEQAPAGAEVAPWDELRAIPPYDQDVDRARAPESVTRFREAIAAADGLLIATPEYNASVPGALKNAIDWASRPRASTPLQGKPAAVIGATTGSFGAVWAQAEMRKVLSSTGARVVDLDLPVAKGEEAFDDRGALRDEHLRNRLAAILWELVAEIERTREFAVH